jgi:predicted negative regulator of RcsB-dependent stress response
MSESMAAQSVAPRSRRPAAPDTEDVVLARAIEFSEWARRNAVAVIITAVALVALVGGAIYYRTYQAERSARAAADFMQLEQSAGMVADPVVIGADLQRFIDRYSGTEYADEARVLLGRLHLQAGQPAEAIPPLAEAARRAGRTAIGAQAGLLLGAAHEQTGNPAAALEAYDEVSRRARFELDQRQALEAIAALQLQQGDATAAANVYRDLVARSAEGSMHRAVYEMRMTEAQSIAQQQ